MEVFTHAERTSIGCSPTAVGRMLNLSPLNAIKAPEKGKEAMGKLKWRIGSVLEKRLKR